MSSESYDKSRREYHREYHKQYGMSYREKNRCKIKEQHKRWVENNKEARKLHQKKYRLNKKTYYKKDNNLKTGVIHNVDCLEGLRVMRDDSVDLAITSPPYNMNLRISNGKYISRQIVKEFSTKYEGYDDNMPIEEYYEFNKNVINELLRVSGLVFYNVQFLTGNKRALFKLIGHFSEQLKEVIVWDKINGQPAMQQNVMNSQFEVILVFDRDNAISRMFDKKGNFDRGTLSNLWEIKRGKKITGSHGAVFPEELTDKIISNFSKENDVILDCFMGTGTTAVSSVKHNRSYIGFEISKDYIEIANKRIEEITEQTNIYDYIN